MPKKAAEPKAVAAKPAAEKPAAAASKAPAAEKAPQAKGTGAGSKQHDEGDKRHDGAAKRSDGPRRNENGGGNNFQGKSDPAIDKINANIEDIKSQIKKCQDEVSSLDKKIEAKKADNVNISSGKSEVKTQLDDLKKKIAEANKEKQLEHEKADEVHRLREIKILQSQKMRDAFPGRAPTPAASDEYLKTLDEDIRKKELLHASRSHSLPEEKKLLAEITTLQQCKKQFKEYKALQQEIAADLQKRKDFNAAAKVKGDVVADLKKEQQELLKSNSSVVSQIQAARSEVDDLYSKRAQERDKITKLRAEQDAQYQQLRVLREKKREQYLKKKEEQAIANQEYAERKRKVMEEKKKEEENREPYEDELATCEHILNHLRTYVPKEEKPAESTSDTSSPAAPLRSNAPIGTALKKEKEEEGPLKQKKQARKKAPVAKSDTINHDIRVFGYFEFISISPPNKISEVEATIAQVEAKKEHFQKLAVDQVEARRVRREKEAKEQEEKQRADALAAEQAANTTTTTTTTSTEEVQVA